MRIRKMRRKVVLMTLAIIALSLAAAKLFVPTYVTSLRQSHELALRQDLVAMRAVLNQYTLDNHRRPQSLDDLVIAGYLKRIPLDPTTGRKDTWVVECSGDPVAPGIVSITSAYDSSALKRTARCD
jgi:general secretion pathway protein G